ncbi:MAG: O-methyltransferase [Solirubrobacterales bacterium]
MRQTPSFEKIDYSLRPAKSTERWMLVEALGRLAPFSPIADYRYVGFGSPFFVDFRLFHRRLAITDMISIEHETEYEDRFKFNAPFECVTLVWGEAGDVIPDLDWELPTIVWLDYDYKLENSVFSDMSQVVDRAKHGDSFIVTVDADPPESDKEVEDIEVGLGRVGGSLGSYESLAGWKLAEHFYDLMQSRIDGAMKDRGARLEWVQLFRFHYKDSARMLTYGGVFVDPSRREDLLDAHFEDLPFVVKKGKDPFQIVMPLLTIKETQAVDKFMPGDLPKAISTLGELGIARDQVERYARIYRHAPNFPESQL